MKDRPPQEDALAATLCTYEYSDGQNKRPCGRPVLDGSSDSMCLRHSADNGRDPQTAMRVWQEARGLMDQGCFIFRGWHFPQDPNCQGFEGQTFSRFTDFTEAVFEGCVFFMGARFKIPADFSRANFNGDANFHHATFEISACFERAVFCGTASFDKASCKGYIVFPECRFRERAHFHGTSFEGVADFPSAVFAGVAAFGGASFQGPTDFRCADFHASAYFDGATVRRGMDFQISLPSPKGKPFRIREAGETAYRLAKQAGTDRGDYRAAGEYHYAEQCAIERGRRRQAKWRPFWSRTNPVFCWLEFGLGRCLFGYGEKPHRPLLAGIGVILLCASLYWSHGGVAPGGSVTTQPVQYQPSPMECLHFSAVTFTTLGYGDYQPKPNWRWLADLEAFAGAALMALFIVSLARKYAR